MRWDASLLKIINIFGSQIHIPNASLLFQESLEACQALSERFTEIEKKRSELAVYLCEDANQLSLEELFGTIGIFRELFIKSLKVREDSLLIFVILNMVFLLCKMGLLFFDNEHHTGGKNGRC